MTDRKPRHRPCPRPPRLWTSRLRFFPSCFLRITCDRCGKDRMLNDAHVPQRDMPIRVLLARMRHDGCSGRVELLTGIDGASSGPTRRIVLRSGG